MADGAIHKRIDWVLLGALAGILMLSVAFVASADPTGGGKAWRQAVWILLGAAAMAGVLRLGYVRILTWSYTLYGATVAMLVAVLFTRPINGATSWFDLWVFRFQPSELVKIVVILTTAQYLMYRDNYKRLWGLIVPLGIALLPVAIILKQPDLGTAMTFIPVVFAMLFAAGARLKHLALVAACGAAGMVGLWMFIMSTVQKMRVHSWLDPLAYEAREAYQLIQSMIAIGSGGLLGRGFLMGPQNRWGRLPEKETDFIFAVLCEEWGFAGALLLLTLFAVMLFAGLGIAGRTRDPAGRLVAVGVVALIAGQLFINISVTTGLLPTTGVTLPLMSYGGSSMVSSLVSIGVLLSVAVHQPRTLRRTPATA